MPYSSSINQTKRMVGTITHNGVLPRGTYYVGDLCYVVKDDEWENYCDRSFPDDGYEHIGIFENYDGIGYATFGTKYGDGEYFDQYGDSYAVDSGSIGCIPISAVADKYDMDEIIRLGNIVSFNEPFYCEYDDETGTIRIGHVEIVTGQSEDEDEDEYDYDSEDEE